jgi:cyclic pyranopterin monophosphate synthase
MNNPLCDARDTLLGRRRVSWEWGRGHAGDVRNERADYLAVAGARQVQRTGRSFKSKSPGAGAESPELADSEPEPGLVLTHLDASGEARMVPVGGKKITDRVAEARGSVLMRPATLRLVREGGFDKGDVIAAARIAGIMAAKSTPQLIPLCHPIPLTQVQVEITEAVSGAGLDITATVSASWKTGVEMEALTAVAVAALSLYDTAKAFDRAAVIAEVRLLEKRGGEGGEYRAAT